MADAAPGFLCCSLLSDELSRAAGRLGLGAAPTVCFASSCHLPDPALPAAPQGLASLLADRETVLAVCMCCQLRSCPSRRGWAIAALEHPRLRLLTVETQGELFMGVDASEHALASGAFLVLPGWLEVWRAIIVEKWGFDRQTATSFFREAATHLLFLDTGRSTPWQADLMALSDFVGLPREVRYVGVSHLETLLDRAFERQHHTEALDAARRAVSESRARAAEYAALADFLTHLGSLPSEEAIAGSLQATATALFAPEEARLAGPDEPPPDEADPTSFATDVVWGDRRLGRLLVRGLALPEHRARYLPLASTFCDATAIALNASRLYRSEQDLTRQLAQKVEELDQFAYVASHDLQAPLRRLVSFTELLVKNLGGDLPPTAATCVDHIQRNALAMRSLVQDLLRLSRAGTSPLRREPAALDTCLDRALAALATLVEEAGATVRRGPLPTVVGDAGLLAQVFQNLVGNALKFVAPGCRPDVEVSARREMDRWVVAVADNGIGIAPEHARTIFAPFQRLHPADRYPGSGIGLAICSRIVNRHGGEIRVEPGHSGGSVFLFTLPTDPT